MKHKEGDTITIRPDLKVTHSCVPKVIEGMLAHAGKETKIKVIHEEEDYSVYELEIDNGACHWTNAMFEDAVDVTESTVKSGGKLEAPTTPKPENVKPASQSPSKEDWPGTKDALFELNQDVIHVKSKGMYKIVGLPDYYRIEATYEAAYAYVGIDEGACPVIWVRSQKEMEDGRFVVR